jgi:mRNA interferase RelE/StbE
MASYSVHWKTSAAHDLKKLDRQFVSQILSAIEALSENPFPAKCRKLRGSGSSYRVRVGDYRVVYQVDTQGKDVTVFHVRHRKDAYRK